MKKILLFTLLLFIELSIAIAGNPIMGIRCRSGVALNIDSEQVVSNAEGFSPDCSALSDCVESCPEEDLYWNTSTLACGCDVMPRVTNVAVEVTFFNACGCPEGLGDGDGGTVFTTPDFGSDEGSFGFQTCIPYENCFDGEIAFVLAPLTCDLPAGEDTIRVTITQADGNPLPPGAFVTIESLVNCDLIDEDDVALLALMNQFDGVDGAAAAFQADADGVILIEFTRDLKTEPSILDFGDYGMMTVPGCPTLDASDPCSCNPQNITDTDGTVLFWYDELTILGSSDSIITLVQNIEDDGFLMVDASTPFADGMDLGTIVGGSLVVPYFRSADALTIDIIYSYQGGTAETSFTETCGLAPTACASDPIPTMGEWGLMIMSLLLLIIGVVSFQYKGKTLIPIKERVKRM